LISSPETIDQAFGTVWNDRQTGTQERFDMPQPPNAKIIIRIKKLSEIAEALRRGKVFPITRLTTIKSLCACLREFRTRCDKSIAQNAIGNSWIERSMS
jgi:hypothetical protein